MSKVLYAERAVGPFLLYRHPVPRQGMMGLAPGQGADGYGKKITTDIKLQFRGEKRRYRVYCCCYSNSGSLYIQKDGQDLYLGTVSQSDVIDETAVPNA